MNRQEKIDKLNASIFRLKQRLNGLVEQEQDEVARPKLRKLVGRCFKYLNSYGDRNLPRWWVYAKVVDFKESDLTFRTVRFQHTTRKRVEIEYETVWNFEGCTRFGVNSDWMPISTTEYNRARRTALQFVRKLLEE